MDRPTRRLPPIRAISVFEAAARHQSFTRAAQELGMTQAAVSYQIKRLEQRLGIPLFKRESRKVVLTHAGEQLSPTVIEAFKALRGAFTHVVERSESELAITSLPTIGANWLVPRLGAFQLANPRLSVRLDTSVPLRDLEHGEFDVSIRNGSGEWPGLVTHLLLPGLFTPLCSPALLSEGKLKQPEDLLRLPRMGRERWWREWLQQAGVADLDLSGSAGIDLGVEQFEVTAAISGHGVAMTSPLFFQQEIAAGRLAQPFDLVLRDHRDYWLAYPASRRASTKIQLFRDWLLEEAQRDRAHAPG